MNDDTSTAQEDLAPNDPRRLQEVHLLQRAMARGFDAEAFMATDIGMYFRARASRELEEAQEELLSVNLASTIGREQAQALQMQARVAQRVLTWFADAVTEGEIAATQFQQAFDESLG